jgi:hypothetical protein
MKNKLLTLEDLSDFLGLTPSQYLEYEEIQEKTLSEEEYYEALRFEMTQKVKLTKDIRGKNG